MLDAVQPRCAIIPDEELLQLVHLLQRGIEHVRLDWRRSGRWSTGGRSDRAGLGGWLDLSVGVGLGLGGCVGPNAREEWLCWSGGHAVDDAEEEEHCEGEAADDAVLRHA